MMKRNAICSQSRKVIQETGGPVVLAKVAVTVFPTGINIATALSGPKKQLMHLLLLLKRNK